MQPTELFVLRDAINVCERGRKEHRDGPEEHQEKGDELGNEAARERFMLTTAGREREREKK